MRSDPWAIFKEYADRVCPLREESPPAAPVAVEVPAAPEVCLSWNQKIALLALSPHGEAAYSVYWRLKEQTELPSLHLSDYHALVGMGFAFRAPSKRYHELTDLGRHTANDVAKAIATERGIHAFYANNASRYHSTVRCTCGWATTYSKTNRLMSMDRIRAEGAHLSSVRAVSGLAKVLAHGRAHA